MAKKEDKLTYEQLEQEVAKLTEIAQFQAQQIDALKNAIVKQALK